MPKDWPNRLFKDHVVIKKTLPEFKSLTHPMLKELRTLNPGADWLYIEPELSSIDDLHWVLSKKLSRLIRIGYELALPESFRTQSSSLSVGFNLKEFKSPIDLEVQEVVLKTYEEGTYHRWGNSVAADILNWGKRNFHFFLPQFEVTVYELNGHVVGLLCFMNHQLKNGQFNRYVTWIWKCSTLSKEQGVSLSRHFESQFCQQKVDSLWATVADYNQPSIDFFERMRFSPKWLGLILE